MKKLIIFALLLFAFVSTPASAQYWGVGWRVPSIATAVGASHDAVTLAGQNYLTLSGQQITAGTLALTSGHISDISVTGAAAGNTLVRRASGVWVDSTMLWNAIGDPPADGSLSFGNTSQIIEKTTSGTATGDESILQLSYTNSFSTDALTQAMLRLTSSSSSGSGALERGIWLLHADDSALTAGFFVESNNGAVTTAFDGSDTEIGAALAIGANNLTVGGVTITAGQLAWVDSISTGGRVAGNVLTFNGTNWVDSTASGGGNFLLLPISAWIPTSANGANDTTVSYIPAKKFSASTAETLSVDFDLPSTTSSLDTIVVFAAINQTTGDSLGFDIQTRATDQQGVAVNSQAFATAAEVIKDMGATANVPARFAFDITNITGVKRVTLKMWRNPGITNDQSGAGYILTAYGKGTNVK
jgi:hypothetical protein